jgi:GTP cyclohydrolase FolE2
MATRTSETGKASVHIATPAVLRQMSPEMQREYAADIARMMKVHVDMLETASANLKANAVSGDSSCACAVDLVNAICSCAGTALGSILQDL